MKQQEFDAQLGQMRRERKQAIDSIASMQADIKEEIAARNRIIDASAAERARLKHQREALHVQRMNIEREYNRRINTFLNDHKEELETSWQEVSTYTLIKQLRKRGWRGDLRNIFPDTAPEHVERVNIALNADTQDTEE